MNSESSLVARPSVARPCLACQTSVALRPSLTGSLLLSRRTAFVLVSRLAYRQWVSGNPRIDIRWYVRASTCRATVMQRSSIVLQAGWFAAERMSRGPLRKTLSCHFSTAAPVGLSCHSTGQHVIEDVCLEWIVTVQTAATPIKQEGCQRECSGDKGNTVMCWGIRQNRRNRRVVKYHTDWRGVCKAAQSTFT